MAMKAMPKSYLPEEEREELIREGDMDIVYLLESQAAGHANDENTAWAWLSLVALPAHTLMSFKRRRGAQFIRDKGLNTTQADIAYGLGWLDQP